MRTKAHSFFLPLLLFLTLSFGCTKRTAVLCENSADGVMRIEIAEINDPEFPFGPTHCNARLYRNDTLLREENFDMKNDGKHASEENFSVLWKSDQADIIVRAEEEEEKIICLRFE